LDTCVVSEFVKPSPATSLIEWLRETDDLLMALSAITMGEIQFGISCLPGGKRRTGLREWLEGVLIPRFDGRILSATVDDTLLWGEIRGEAQRNGNPVPATDALIAAIAKNNRLTLVTRNVPDFERMDVPLLNPW